MFRRLPENYLAPSLPASVYSGPTGTAAGGRPHFHAHPGGHAIRAQAPAACRYPPCTAEARPDGWCSDSCRELAADIADSWREPEERDL